MELFLYLGEPWWANAWVNGGQIPITPASAYVAEERSATQTPDEILQRATRGVTPEQAELLSRFAPGSTVRLSDTAFSINGVRSVVDHGEVATRFEDSQILCFSRLRSRYIRDRFKKKAAVRILNLDLLKDTIKTQTGLTLRSGPVSYTRGPNRHHFLKHMDDAWQVEWRISVTGGENVVHQIELPPGIAEAVDLENDPSEFPDLSQFHYERYDAERAPPPRPPVPPINQAIARAFNAPKLSPPQSTQVVDRWLADARAKKGQGS